MTDLVVRSSEHHVYGQRSKKFVRANLIFTFGHAREVGESVYSVYHEIFETRAGLCAPEPGHKANTDGWCAT